MTDLLAIVFAIVYAAGALPLQQAAAAGEPSREVRCAVPFFRGGGTPEGTATMTTVSDGRPCAVMNWGVPTQGRNPATDGRITQPPKHGTAMFAAPRALYSAEE